MHIGQEALGSTHWAGGRRLRQYTLCSLKEYDFGDNEVLLIHVLFAGWDFIHSDEVNMGAVMTAAGYYTAQYGKWHNLNVVGYEPWNTGFMVGGVPTHAELDGLGLMR